MLQPRLRPAGSGRGQRPGRNHGNVLGGGRRRTGNGPHFGDRHIRRATGDAVVIEAVAFSANAAADSAGGGTGEVGEGRDGSALLLPPLPPALPFRFPFPFPFKPDLVPPPQLAAAPAKMLVGDNPIAAPKRSVVEEAVSIAPRDGVAPSVLGTPVGVDEVDG